MPSATHLRLANTAIRLIKSHGRAMDLVCETNIGSEDDPDITEKFLPITGVQTKLKTHEIDGDLVQRGDVMYLLDSEVAADVDMRVKDGSTTRSIIEVVETVPGETSMIYKVRCRR